MDNFVAIDVETANNYPSSICAIGAVKVVDGVIADRFYELVKPEPDFYFRHFTQNIHGIGPRDTENARTFDRVWQDVKAMAGDLPFVAHNKSFDEKCIRECHRVYRMDYPYPPFHCTLAASRRMIPRQHLSSYSLPYVCEFLGIPFFNHHNALADAEACAKIAMVLL
ncbi:MAG: 3'-5' exonuclease [Muribaculaceae bacterium]|nr:3'-5' exonuclease [Muribaculaceae bacterium]